MYTLRRFKTSWMESIAPPVIPVRESVRDAVRWRWHECDLGIGIECFSFRIRTRMRS